MKMSDVMTGLGYGAIQGGQDLIQKEREREQREANLKHFRKADTIDVQISRSLEGEGDEPITVLLEVRDYQPPDKRHYSGCEYFPGSVEFGDAWTEKGESFELTPLERETAEAEAIERMFPKRNY